MTDDLDWDGDWQAIESDALRTRLEEELHRELPPTHVLSGTEFVALGRRHQRDDVLFRLQDGRFAQVHLTWAAEVDPRWPHTRVFATFEAWKAEPFEDR